MIFNNIYVLGEVGDFDTSFVLPLKLGEVFPFMFI